MNDSEVTRKPFEQNKKSLPPLQPGTKACALRGTTLIRRPSRAGHVTLHHHP